MFKRKLTALDYPSPDNFNVNGKLGYSLVCSLTFVLEEVQLSNILGIYNYMLSSVILSNDSFHGSCTPQL
jgi:hypothetical protein